MTEPTADEIHEALHALNYIDCRCSYRTDLFLARALKYLHASESAGLVCIGGNFIEMDVPATVHGENLHDMLLRAVLEVTK